MPLSADNIGRPIILDFCIKHQRLVIFHPDDYGNDVVANCDVMGLKPFDSQMGQRSGAPVGGLKQIIYNCDAFCFLWCG